jgi:hypothetical protein
MQGLLVKTKLIPTLLVAVMLVSCTSYRVITLPNDIEAMLQKGDTVKVITKDGRELMFEVTDITPEAIISENQRVLFSDIARVEKRHISAGKTAALGAGILVGFLALIGVSIAFGGSPK